MTPHDEPTPETDAVWENSEVGDMTPLLEHGRQLERDRNRLRAQLAGVVEQAIKRVKAFEDVAQHDGDGPGVSMLRAVQAHLRTLDLPAVKASAPTP